MPTTTSGFYYPDASSSASLETLMAAAATSQQGVIDNLILGKRQVQTFVWADSAERNSETGMTAGDQGYQVDAGAEFRYDGSNWRIREGLQRIRPGSISVTGGTGSADSSGQVTFNLTGAGSVSVRNVFSSLFQAYQIDLTSSASPASTLTVFLADSLGASDTASNYDRTEILGRNATASSTTSAGASGWALGNQLDISQTLIEINSPNIATPARGFSRVGIHTNPAASNTSNLLKFDYLTHRSSTAYPSFNLSFSAAVSGNVRVYGVA